jgi:hypothetical protein
MVQGAPLHFVPWDFRIEFVRRHYPQANAETLRQVAQAPRITTSHDCSFVKYFGISDRDF